MSKSKLTTCKVCGAEVAKSAKVCPQCGAKLNKMPFIARLLIVIVVLVSVISIISILLGDDNSSPSNTSSSIPSSNTTSQQSEGTTSQSSSDVVVLDDDVVKVTYKKVEPSVGIEGCYLGLKVENKTDSEIWVYLDKASVNDEMIPLVMSGVPMYIQPDKSSSNPFILPFANLSIKSVEEIETISFKVVVENNETNKNIETSETLTINVK